MRIAVLTSSYPRFAGDGTAPFIQSISEHLMKLGHGVAVLAPHDPSVRPMDTQGVQIQRFRYVWPERFHIMGHGRSLEADVRLRPLAVLLLPPFLLFAFFALFRLTGRQKSQVIHAHWVLPSGLVVALVAAFRHIPFVVSLHGSDVFVARRNPLFGFVARWIFRRAAVVTACSPELRDAAIALGASQSRVFLLPYGVNPDKFTPARRSAEGRQTRGYADSDLVIAAIGRLVYKKGFSTLMAALPHVLAHCPPTRLVLGGEGPLKGELMRRAVELGVDERVTFVGRVAWEDVPDFLACADVFALPSVRDHAGNVDGLPTVLLEAMSCGLPAVASDIGGVPLIVRSGENGILVPAGNAQALAEGLLQLLTDHALRLRYSQAARRAMETQFNWNVIVSRLSSLIEEALARA